MARVILIFLSVLLIAGNARIALAATICVPINYPTIQSGINAASDGDTVLVANGTYTGAGNVNLDFKGNCNSER